LLLSSLWRSNLGAGDSWAPAAFSCYQFFLPYPRKGVSLLGRTQFIESLCLVLTPVWFSPLYLRSEVHSTVNHSSRILTSPFAIDLSSTSTLTSLIPLFLDCSPGALPRNSIDERCGGGQGPPSGRATVSSRNLSFFREDHVRGFPFILRRVSFA